MTDCAIRIHLGAHKTATTYLQDLLVTTSVAGGETSCATDAGTASKRSRGTDQWMKNRRSSITNMISHITI